MLLAVQTEAALKGVMMLQAANVVAFIPTVDSSKAHAFYEGAPSLRVISADLFSTAYNANGVELRIQKVSAFTPSLTRRWVLGSSV